jgi:transcriptional regulator with XRE-family HTH domain
VIRAVTKNHVNRCRVGNERIRGNIKRSVCRRAPYLFDKRFRVFVVALSEMPREHQLGCAIQSNERVGIANLPVARFFRPLVPLFFLYVRPAFVKLQFVDGQVLDTVAEKLFARFARQRKHIQDGALLDVAQPRSAAHAVKLAKERRAAIILEKVKKEALEKKKKKMLSPIKTRLGEKLKDKAYRHRFFQNRAQDEIASELRHFRKKRKLKQKALAELCGMKQSAVSRIEQASYSKWNLGTLWRLGEALDVRIRVVIDDASDAIREYEQLENAADVPQNAAAENAENVLSQEGLVTSALPQNWWNKVWDIPMAQQPAFNSTLNRVKCVGVVGVGEPHLPAGNYSYPVFLKVDPKSSFTVLAKASPINPTFGIDLRGSIEFKPVSMETRREEAA